MSGDVQPKKRKDRKRKKEEEPSPTPPVHVFSKESSEDVNIHVHKEEGTGGGICAKIIFFVLFSALIVLIGLIITEHRGLTDLEVDESESKYSQIFEGWVDKEKHDDYHTLDDHDNEHFDDEEQESDSHTLDDHDGDHMDDDEINELSEEEHTLDDHDNENFNDDESSPVSEENVESLQEESLEIYEDAEKLRRNTRFRRKTSEHDNDISESQEEEQEDDSSNIYANIKGVDDGDDTADSTNEEDTEEHLANASENMYEEEEENSKNQDDGVNDSEEEDDDTNSVEEKDPNDDSETEEDIEVNYKSSDVNSNSEYGSQADETDNFIPSSHKTNEAIDAGKDHASQEADDEVYNGSDRKATNLEKSTREITKENAENDENKEFINDSFEVDSSEKPDIQKKPSSHSKESIQENTAQQNENAEHEDEGKENGNSGGSDHTGSLSMIVKAIIGAAILAVGHFVLVKKWKSDSPDETNGRGKDVHIDLTRRNTLIAPPPLQDIEHDGECDDKDFLDGDDAENADIFKEKYAQLRSSYSRSRSPESDTGQEPKYNESEEELEAEELGDEEDEEIEDMTDEEEMEELEDEDIDDGDYENEDYEEDDDEELMRKLEAKYGKLKLELKTKERTPSTDLDESESDKLSDDYEFAGVTNKDDWQIRKELDEAQLNLGNE